jgi:hypothetical protein
LKSLIFPAPTDRWSDHGSGRLMEETDPPDRREPAIDAAGTRPDISPQEEQSSLVPVARSEWNDAELNTAILTLCDEIPGARMVSCWRALDHCRRSTPRGTPESLLAEMRETLRRDIETQQSVLAGAV